MSTDGLVDWVVEAMTSAMVMSREMMGGHMLYADRQVFAMIAGHLLWFKADKVSDAEWDAAGCERFTFDMGGKTGSMNYRRARDASYDDAETLRRRAALAVAPGMRGQAAKAKRPQSSRPAAA